METGSGTQVSSEARLREIKGAVMLSRAGETSRIQEEGRMAKGEQRSNKEKKKPKQDKPKGTDTKSPFADKSGGSAQAKSKS